MQRLPPPPGSGAAAVGRSPLPTGPVLPRLPVGLRLLAVFSLLGSLWVAVTALSDVIAAALLDRSAYVLLVRDRQLSILEQVRAQVPGPTAAGAVAPAGGSDLLRQLAEPFLRLPAADSDRLALLLGAAYSDRRRVVVPLGLLQLLCCWLLLSGALATLRRQGWGPSMWSFAAWAGIGFALLHTLVAFVDSRNLMARLGPPAAAALAQANSISVDQAMSHLWQLARLGVVFRAAIEGVWVLLLGLSALYIRRWLPHKRAPILPSRDRRGRPRSAR